MLQSLEPWMKGIWWGQDSRPQSLKEMQRNNLEGRPQIHFRNQGFPPAKRLVCIRRQEAGGRREETSLPGQGLGGLGAMFLPPHVPEHVPCTHTHSKWPGAHQEGQKGLCQNHKKKTGAQVKPCYSNIWRGPNFFLVPKFRCIIYFSK